MITRFKNFADIFVPADDNGNVDPKIKDALDKLQNDHKLAYYEFSGDKVVPPLPRTVPVLQPSPHCPIKLSEADTKTRAAAV